MHILFKYASRSRPVRFFEALHSLIDLLSDKENYTVFCSLDADDLSMANIKEDKHFQEHEVYKHVIFDWGHSKSKIDAINRPVPASIAWDILVNFSDDMRFQVYGYDQLIREGVRCNGPDVFLHYPDSTAQNMLPTMSIMDRTYFERDGYIYHPSYSSLWCDNESMAVAQARGRYFYMGIQIFDHYHPAYGHVPWDEQYTRQQSFWNEDEINFIYRKSKNFFIDAPINSDSDNNRSNGTIQ